MLLSGRNNMRRMNLLILIILIIFTILFIVLHLNNEKADYGNYADHGVEPSEKVPYGVSADNSLATEVGMRVLKHDGNAVDAAVAVSYALGVTDPYGSGIGGGGVMMVHPPKADPIVYNYMPMEPKYGHSSDDEIGIPGFVAGMEEVHKDFGERPMKDLMEPSIKLSNDGFDVGAVLHNRLNGAAHRMSVDHLSHLFPNGKAIAAGNDLKQEDLTETLRIIRKEGAKSFYHEEIAENITDNIKGIGLRDMESYYVSKQKPVKGKFSGFDVYSAGPPAGGTTLIQNLQLADYLEVSDTEDHSSDFIHLMGEIDQKTYQDRVEHIGDPEFTDVPIDKMLSHQHMKDLAQGISLSHASKEDQTPLNTIADQNGDGDTTHFVVVDDNGMMVSVTNTLSNFFGSGRYIDGFFLNNELRNFSKDNDSPNSREDGKRVFSSVSPTILSKNKHPVIGIGSAGGYRIPTYISQTLIRMVKFNQSPQKAVDHARSFVSIDNDNVALEDGMPHRQRAISKLQEFGYQFSSDDSSSNTFFGSIQALAIDYRDKTISGGSDHRRDGDWQSAKSR